MTERSADRSGILILRARAEGDPASRLRVHVTRVTGDREETMSTVTDAGAACALVSAWLDELATPDEHSS